MYVFLYNIIEDIRICHLECQISTIIFSWLYVIPKLGLFTIRTNSVDILLLKIDPYLVESRTYGTYNNHCAYQKIYSIRFETINLC